MREPRKLPKGALPTTPPADDLRDAIQDGLHAGYDVSIWAWRPEDPCDGDPAWRVHYQRVTWEAAIAQSRKKLTGALTSAKAQLAAHCQPGPVSGLPADQDGWERAASLLCDVFAAGLREGVSVELRCLLPDSRMRAPGRLRRLAPTTSTTCEPAEHDTYYRLDFTESHGGSQTEWLRADAVTLLGALQAASDLVPRALDAMAAEDERQAARTAAWREHQAKQRAAQG